MANKRRTYKNKKHRTRRNRKTCNRNRKTCNRNRKTRVIKTRKGGMPPKKEIKRFVLSKEHYPQQFLNLFGDARADTKADDKEVIEKADYKTALKLDAKYKQEDLDLELAKKVQAELNLASEKSSRAPSIDLTRKSEKKSGPREMISDSSSVAEPKANPKKITYYYEYDFDKMPTTIQARVLEYRARHMQPGAEKIELNDEDIRDLSISIIAGASMNRIGIEEDDMQRLTAADNTTDLKKALMYLINEDEPNVRLFVDEYIEIGDPSPYFNLKLVNALISKLKSLRAQVAEPKKSSGQTFYEYNFNGMPATIQKNALDARGRTMRPHDDIRVLTEDDVNKLIIIIRKGANKNEIGINFN